MACWLIYDVNGEKGPNYQGRDVFAFYIQQYDKFSTNEHWVKVCGGGTCKTGYSNSRSIHLSQCKNYGSKCNCTKLLEQDGWEFKNDYPIRL